MIKSEQFKIIEDSLFNKPMKYSELCNVFGIEKKRGGYLQKQLNSLRKEYEIEKNGKYYIIIKKLTEQDKLDIIYYDNLKSHIEMLMCTLFTFPKYCTSVKFDMKGLMNVLQIVNNDYHITKYGKNKKYANELLGLEDDNGKNLSIFFGETEQMIQRIIKETLKELEDKQIIKINKTVVLAKKVYNKKNNKILKIEKHELNSDESIDAFMQCKKETLKELGFKKESELFKLPNSMRLKYISMVSNKINHDYYYYNYRLILNTKHIKEYVIKDEEQKKRIERSCNNLIKKKIISSNQGELKTLSKNYKQTYVDALIDIDNDLGLRYKYKNM